MRQKKKHQTQMKAWMAAGTVAAVLASPVAGFAAEAGEGEAVDENLGEVVVTATRSEKREMDVPAAMTVVTAEDIHASGAQNAAEALARTDGFVYAAFGQNGAAMGTMANDATIRGVDNGTLVLVNGNPISWRGKYDLSAIPAATIDRIEVVKGPGSVLYGSEAMAGVINIITKKGASNQVTAGIGNSGQHHYGVLEPLQYAGKEHHVWSRRSAPLEAGWGRYAHRRCVAPARAVRSPHGVLDAGEQGGAIRAQ